MAQLETESESKPTAVEKRKFKAAFRSMAQGLSSPDPEIARRLSVGLDSRLRRFDKLFKKTKKRGGVLLVRGEYGSGKTLTLTTARAAALEQGFAFAETEIDASEVRLDKAPSVYRSLMERITFPDGGRGLEHLALAVKEWLRDKGVPNSAHDRFKFLLGETDCEPLAWMLSDIGLTSNTVLMNAFKGVPTPAGDLRKNHRLSEYEYSWPYFGYGTQGDVGCYLISGISRLLYSMGCSGLIVALDEMEKWQNLDWKDQDRASNLVGGLIWSATAKLKKRNCEKYDCYERCTHPPSLAHSRTGGGAPFGTKDRCHLGLIIAMTPRFHWIAPEERWKQFGPIDICELPAYTMETFSEHYDVIVDAYERVYEFRVDPKLKELIVKTLGEYGVENARSATMTIVGFLDSYRKGQA